MDLTPEEQNICDAAVTYVKENKKDLIATHIQSKPEVQKGKPLAIFMAGSPGAGKTEFAETFLENPQVNGLDVVCIDPDALRKEMPGYVGDNSYLFQKGVSRLVNELYSAALKQKRSFLLDGTMSSYTQAEQNIERAIKYNYEVYIFYIYQDPVSAWRFTQAREKTEGRRIRKDTFISQFLAAPESVNRLKAHFKKEVTVNLIVKDVFHKIKKYEVNVDKIDSYIKHTYTKNTLEDTLIVQYDFPH